MKCPGFWSRNVYKHDTYNMYIVFRMVRVLNCVHKYVIFTVCGNSRSFW